MPFVSGIGLGMLLLDLVAVSPAEEIARGVERQIIHDHGICDSRNRRRQAHRMPFGVHLGADLEEVDFDERPWQV